MNLQPGPDRWPISLEKWYVDALLADGGVLLVYLGRVKLLGIARARVTAELFRPGEPDLRGDAPATRWEGGEAWLDLGAARIDGEVFTFETPGLSGRLGFAPRHPPASLGAPFLADGRRRLDWIVEVPDADVRGEVRWPGGALSVSGRGYRDRVRFDLLPWRFPLRDLAWGRIAAGPHAATWAIAHTRSGELGAAWADGRTVAPAERPGVVGTGRVPVEGAVADLPGLRLGAIRPILRWLARDPHEVKWAAPASIADHAGVAVHESVRWS